jgi:1,2-phenylacetyl-CoA epoxidase PaaB subunit
MSVNFTANPIHGGSSPIYQWKLNGNIVGNTSANYSNSGLQDNDVISLSMISSESCVTTSTANATDIVMHVASTFTPQVSIITNDTVSCDGAFVDFHAQPSNGGNSPSYQWLRNGVPVGIDSIIYLAMGLQTGDEVKVIMTSSEACASPSQDTSAAIIVTVNPSVVPMVSITASDTVICQGSQVDFAATPTHGGLAPIYSWKLNGLSVGSNSNTFTSTSLQDGDSVWVVLQSSASCAQPDTAISQVKVMEVNSSLTPMVSITASDTVICQGSQVDFMATPTHGGLAPIYSWKLNGLSVGSNSNTFNSTSLQDGDSVWVVLQSSASCAQPDTAISQVKVMEVNSTLTPMVSITASDTVICQGSQVDFAATPTHGGLAPIYSWKLNGLSVGSNSNTFTSTSLQDGDSVWVVLQSSASCAQPDTAISQVKVMEVNSLLTPKVSLSASDTVICQGSQVDFTATPTHGGSSPIYSWKLNGLNVGSNSNTFTSTSLQDGDSVWVVLQSSASCAQPDTAISQDKVMEVNLIPSTPAIIRLDSISLSSSVQGTDYEWFLNGSLLAFNSQIINPTADGGYQVMVIENGCKSDTSQVYQFIWNKMELANRKLSIAVYPNPNKGAFRVDIQQLVSEPLELYFYDGFGRLIYSENLSAAISISKQIHLNTLAKGVYYLKVVASSNMVTVEKVVIQ